MADTGARAARRRIGGPAAWRGEAMARQARWLRVLSPEALADLDAALRHVKSRGLSLMEVGREDFPLAVFAAELAALVAELREGSGVMVLRGLPVERYSAEEARLVFWGIGAHLGTPVSQSKNGEFLGEVRDLGVVLDRPDSRGYRSRQRLRFHTDRCDVVGLLCVRKAKSGGLSRMASSAAIHDEILARRPDLLEALYGTYFHSRQGEEAPDEGRFYPNPIFGECGGRFTSQYSRMFITIAQDFPEVPRISAAQSDALDLVDALAEELSFSMDLQPGDMQFLNNHVIYHARTAYDDYEEPALKRLLYRLWLAVPWSPELPAGYEVLWGATEAGALRGGVQPASGARYFRKRAPGEPVGGAESGIRLASGG
jgi:hypothetical protein